MLSMISLLVGAGLFVLGLAVGIWIGTKIDLTKKPEPFSPDDAVESFKESKRIKDKVEAVREILEPYSPDDEAEMREEEDAKAKR